MQSLIETLSNGLNINSSRFKDCSTIEQCMDKCRHLIFSNVDYSDLAGRLRAKQLQSSIPKSFSEAVSANPQLTSEFKVWVMNLAEEIDSMIVPERDYMFDNFGIATLEKSYLGFVIENGLRRNLETPQYMYMRVAVFLWYPDVARIKETYDSLSLGYISHASPTLFNSGTRKPGASCYLLSSGDNLNSISEYWRACGIISKKCGGIGMDVSSIRHSLIGNKYASASVPQWCKITDEIVKTVNQNGARDGAAALYINVWHIDIQSILTLRDPKTTAEQHACHNSFFGILVNDLFMERVKKREKWTLMCPYHTRDEKTGKTLNDMYGSEFEMHYLASEAHLEISDPQCLNHKVINAYDLYRDIITSAVQIGGYYILNKDAFNRKSNHKHMGTIKCSNLCTEIIEYTEPSTYDENDMVVNHGQIATCNLASISLDECVVDGKFDFVKLENMTRICVRNLNQLIDRSPNVSALPSIQDTNHKTRPLGIGVQGLADAILKLGMTWKDENTVVLNKHIFETMYYGAVSESIELAKIHGFYPTFPGSPASQGKFQFDLWDEEEKMKKGSMITKRSVDNSRYNWDNLREDMMKYGMRNSLLIALMPTASTAQIRGKSECMDPIKSVVWTRTVKSGFFVIVNKHFFREMSSMGLWKNDLVKSVISNKTVNTPEFIEILMKYGVEESIARRIQEKYLSVYELPTKLLIDMNLDRSRFVCQAISFNLHLKAENADEVASKSVMYASDRGAKTLAYYCRIMLQDSGEINVSMDNFNIEEEFTEVSAPKKDDNPLQPPKPKEPEVFVCKRGDKSCVSCST